jgi:hypothetical protein
MATPPKLGPLPQAVLRLHHGTDEASANALLLHGVDQTEAAKFNMSGEFWATTSSADADTFAQVNPAGGAPARLSFDLPLWAPQALWSSSPPGVYQHTTGGVDWYEFLPSSFPLLNEQMTNREVVSPVP